MRVYFFPALVMLSLLSVDIASAQSQKLYGPEGKKVCLPQGDLSFADNVNFPTVSSHPTEASEDNSPNRALGRYDIAKYSLGCSGRLELEFTDNALIDVAGPDLHVFEGGPIKEATDVYIRRNTADTWRYVGQIAGDKTAVDISEVARPEEAFRQVKLVDVMQACEGQDPGADINAVAAVGSARIISLQDELLFDTDSDNLKLSAINHLKKLAADFVRTDVGRIIVEGHADSQGSRSYNQDLSQRRAMKVADNLLSADASLSGKLSHSGKGEDEPVDLASTHEAYAKNRRVDIYVAASACPDVR